MAIEKAQAFDNLTGKWIGEVPVTWFDKFPHLGREDADGNRPEVAKTPLGTLNLRQARKLAADAGIDIKGLRTKDAVVEAIAAASHVPGDPTAQADTGEQSGDAGS